MALEVAGWGIIVVIMGSSHSARCHFMHTDPNGTPKIEARPGVRRYHQLGDLLNTFEIPDVPDVAEARPEVYAEYLRRLRALEVA